MWHYTNELRRARQSEKQDIHHAIWPIANNSNVHGSPGMINFEIVNTSINSGVVLVGSELWIYFSALSIKERVEFISGHHTRNHGGSNSFLS